MSRWVLFAVAAGAVILARIADSGSIQLAGRQEVPRHAAGDDGLVTGSVRRPSPR